MFSQKSPISPELLIAAVQKHIKKYAFLNENVLVWTDLIELEEISTVELIFVVFVEYE